MGNLATLVTLKTKALFAGFAVTCALCWPAAGFGQALTSLDELPNDLRLHGDVRLRYEHARVDGRALDAEALTFRARIALETSMSKAAWILIEGEGVARIAGEFADGVSRDLLRPVIADPDGIELNRFVLGLRAGDMAQFRVGRQRISLDDQRFIGAVNFRQNDQTFDGVSIDASPLNNVAFSAGYFRRVNRVFGHRSPFGTFTGNSYYLNAALSTPFGTASIYHYALDLETGTFDGDESDHSSETMGVRFAGRRDFGEVELEYEAAYALQRDFADNPTDYRADYHVVDVGLIHERAAISLRREVLGSDNSGGSFQTPLATLHAFQGAADVFLTTPAEGIVDHSVTFRVPVGDFGPSRKLNVFVRRHWFDAERIDADYGREWDVGFSALIGPVNASFKFARYEAATFGSNERRIWIAASRNF